VGREILTGGWHLLQKNEGYQILKEDTPEGSPGRGFWEQAKINGWVINFHTYPAKKLD
jgi:hypothetical protein